MTRKPAPSDSDCNVLLVEDDPDDAFLFERALIRATTATGRTVTVARFGNGWDAIRAVGRRDVIDELPDFVVVDLNMPVMDGLRFLRLLRRELRLPDLPAFVLTTSDRAEDHEAARAEGADHVFVKPESHRDYVDTARVMIAMAAAGRATALGGPDVRRAC